MSFLTLGENVRFVIASLDIQVSCFLDLTTEDAWVVIPLLYVFCEKSCI